MVEGLEEPLQVILDTVHDVIERTPPELTADIYQSGVCLTGGGSLLYGLPELFAEKLNLPAFMADDPISAVALGAGICLDNIEQYQDIIYDYRRGDFLQLLIVINTKKAHSSALFLLVILTAGV